MSCAPPHTTPLKQSPLTGRVRGVIESWSHRCATDHRITRTSRQTADGSVFHRPRRTAGLARSRTKNNESWLTTRSFRCYKENFETLIKNNSRKGQFLPPAILEKLRLRNSLRAILRSEFKPRRNLNFSIQHEFSFFFNRAVVKTCEQ